MEMTKNELQRSRSNASSELTLPMMSPGLRARETSFEGEAGNTSSTTSSTAYDCFNPQLHPKGHFYSANQLYARGVWIGYLAADRQNQSFRGLPSFHDLKINYTKFNPPYPPIVQGSSRENRKAVCRGCAREKSALIAFSEVQFGKKVKVVIMPLDGDDDAGVFAIMLPQKTDRSLPGIQSFRPYEITNGGMGDSFVNNYMMLALRNPDSDAGTLETVLTVLPLQERADIVLKLKQFPGSNKRLSSILGPSQSTDDDVPPLATRVIAKVDDDENNAPADQPAMRKRRKTSDNAARKCEILDISPKYGTVHLAHQINQIPADGGRHHASLIPESSGPSPQATKARDPSRIIPLGLRNEQAERVCFIWPIIDEDIEYEFIHTLGECKSFRGLLDLLEEDAEAIPSAASILARTNMWRLTYRLGAGANKATVARRGTEAAFDRLQTTLAQASIWEDNSHTQINVELNPLSRSDPA